METYIENKNNTIYISRKIINIQKIKYNDIYNFSLKLCKPKRVLLGIEFTKEELSILYNLIYSPIDKPFISIKIQKNLDKIKNKMKKNKMEFYFKKITGKYTLCNILFKILDIKMKKCEIPKSFKFTTCDMYNYYTKQFNKEHIGFNTCELCSLKKLKKYFIMNNNIPLNSDFEGNWEILTRFQDIKNLKLLYKSEKTGNFFYEYTFDSNNCIKLILH